MNQSEKNAKNASVKKISPGDKSALHPKSVKLAIAAFCYHGCYGEEATNSHVTKNEIKNCKETKCQLWNHRGWQQTTGGHVGSKKAG